MQVYVLFLTFFTLLKLHSLEKTQINLDFYLLIRTFAASNIINRTMKATDQTVQQLERALRKVVEKFPATQEATMLTDIHIRVTQETGEVMVFDDDDQELMRCVVEQWIDNKDDDFYKSVTTALRSVINKHKDSIESMSILKPFSLVLEDDDKETVAELYVVDDDTVIIDEELMVDLDKDLDDFFEKLIKE